MQREILFRGKRTDNGEWVEGYIQFNYNKTKARIINPLKLFYIDFPTQYIDVNPETVCQFTGLTDKNGTKIFDDDIISVNGRYPKLMRYIDDYACFCLANIEDLDEKMDTGYWQQVAPGWWNEFGREIEAIGNAYDNPELLKQ